MNEITKTKFDYLNRANGSTSLLALFAIISAIPGGIRLYRFILDAQDLKIEQANLLGFSDFSIPVLNVQVREPYVSLSILILAVVIPVLVLLLLLFKKNSLNHGRTGSGLYWLIALLAILGILIGTGLMKKLYYNDLTNLTALNTDPENLFLTGVSALSLILTLVAMTQTRKAANAPDTLSDDLSDEDADLEIADRDQEPAMPAEAAVAFNEAETSRQFAPEAVLTEDEDLPSDSPDTFRVRTAKGNPALQEDFAAVPVQKADLPAAAPKVTEPVSAKVYETPVKTESRPSAAAASAAKPERTIQRKLLAYPGDDTKVIVILRESVNGKFVREWSEIRLKSDFTRKSGPSDRE